MSLPSKVAAASKLDFDDRDRDHDDGDDPINGVDDDDLKDVDVDVDDGMVNAVQVYDEDVDVLVEASKEHVKTVTTAKANPDIALIVEPDKHKHALFILSCLDINSILLIV
mmetsp:Transcript_18139/g.22203  ORF Transcript_18139/g.22203 Transcript_18139/m.22203 type:complete len:111 (-) Transcript_18139:48-380(-)